MEQARRAALILRREELKRTLYHQQQLSEKQELLAQLDTESAPYQLIWADSPTTEQPLHWLTQNFPIAWWGRIDWRLMPDPIEDRWLDYPDLANKFRRLMLEQQLFDPTVLVTWSDASSLSLSLNLSTVARHAELVFQASWDTWVICTNPSWCIECYHEDDLCFGRKLDRVG